MNELAIFRSIVDEVRGQFKLSINSCHGISHWERVGKIGLYLTAITNADPYVVGLFSILHDSRREDEYSDPEHGPKAAEFALKLHKRGLLPINAKQLTQLIYACKYHTGNKAQSDDITIQTCWDSDRLDLYRVGVIPNPEFLYTEVGKRREAIDFALQLYKRNYEN